jgi:hypothetical protein
MIYTETNIHEETHKGRKNLLLGMIGNILSSVHYHSYDLHLYFTRYNLLRE